MSKWTYINATFRVETNIEEPNTIEIVRGLLANAPKITGSERDADVFVNIPSSSNIFVGADCEHCEFGSTRRFYKKGYFTCKRTVDYECKSANFQTIVVITIHGSLRDRLVEQTHSEYNAFKHWLTHIKGYKFEIDREVKEIFGN
jgi:hypothetical protein